MDIVKITMTTLIKNKDFNLLWRLIVLVISNEQDTKQWCKISKEVSRSMAALILFRANKLGTGIWVEATSKTDFQFKQDLLL